MAGNRLKFCARLLFFHAFFHAKNKKGDSLTSFIEKYNNEIKNDTQVLSPHFNYASSIVKIESNVDGTSVHPEITRKIIFFLRTWCFDNCKKSEKKDDEKKKHWRDKKYNNNNNNSSTTTVNVYVDKGETKRSGQLREERKEKKVESREEKTREEKVEKISLKRATKDELVNIPGIGDKYAKLLIDGISKGINTWKGISEIPGIGSKKLSLLQNYCTL
jgi:DNA uptake protein ComE-like DNA-binding protein